MDAEGRARDGLGRPARDIRGDARAMQEADWQRLGDLLSGLRPTAVQVAGLLDLCEEAGQFGREAVHYQAWSVRLGELLNEIETTPARALNDVERNELIKGLWIAWEETGIRLTRLLTQVTGISLTRVRPEEPGILLTGVDRRFESQSEVLHQPPPLLARDDQELRGGFDFPN